MTCDKQCRFCSGRTSHLISTGKANFEEFTKHGFESSRADTVNFDVSTVPYLRLRHGLFSPSLFALFALALNHT